MLKSRNISTDVINWREDPHAIHKFSYLYHFLPHPELKKRASLLSINALIVYCLIMFIFFWLFSIFPRFFPGVLGYASDINVGDLLTFSNKIRQENNLKRLRLNASLSIAAQKKAEDMFANNYWAHVSPQGTEPWDFILAEGYDYGYAGENLAKNFSTSKEVVSAWYESPSHKENLLSTTYDEIGFGVVNGILDGYETTLVVQMFGRPRDPSYLATIEEEIRTLDKFSNVKSKELPQVTPAGVTMPTEVLPAVDVSGASKAISLSIGLFVAALLILDVWYSRKKAILKFNGHTLVHLSFLLLVIYGIWFVMTPGKIL